MRNEKTEERAWGAVAVSIAIIMLMLGMLAGCATFNGTSGKVLASVAQTADAGMNAWKIYVAKNHLSVEDQRDVKFAYVQYQLAMAAAESAYISMVKTGDRSGWIKARDALTASQVDLISLIDIFIKAKP